MTSEEFINLGFIGQYRILIKKGKHILTRGSREMESNFYSFKHFMVEHRIRKDSKDESIHVVSVKTAREVTEKADEFKSTKNGLAAFNKLSAAEQKKMLEDMKKKKRLE